MKHEMLFDEENKNVRIFLVVNSSNYDGQGLYSAQKVVVDENDVLYNGGDILGFDFDTDYPLFTTTSYEGERSIKDMEVGDILGSDDYEGVCIIRMA